MTEKAERQTMPFADMLQKVQQGKLHRDMSGQLQDLVEAVTETGRAGTLTLTVKVTKSKASGMVEVAAGVKVKAPEAEQAVSMFYVTDDFNLVREDPRQMALPVGPVRIEEPAVGL